MNIKVLCLALCALLLLCSCESGAKFRMENRTSFPVYASVDGAAEISIPGNSEHIFNIDTDTQSFLTGKVERNVPVLVYGETYSLIDNIDSPQQDDTSITVQAGKTLSAVLHPNRASVKIVNNLNHPVARAEIWLSKINYIFESRVAVISDLEAGQQHWERLRPCGQTDPFCYIVHVYHDDDTEFPLIYGDEDNILFADDQFVVTLNPTEP